MTDRTRVLVYVAGLVAAFALAFVLGRAAAPYLGDEPAPDPGHGDMGAATGFEEAGR